MKVYFVATYCDLKKDKFGYVDDGGHQRVVGYFQTLEKAKRAVEENWGDIYEDGYYKYAVIEELEDGLYPCCLKPIFYKWFGDAETGCYRKIRRPKFTKCFYGFTIG